MCIKIHFDISLGNIVPIISYYFSTDNNMYQMCRSFIAILPSHVCHTVHSHSMSPSVVDTGAHLGVGNMSVCLSGIRMDV